MTKNIYMRSALDDWAIFKPENVDPFKINVPDDALFMKCDKNCIYLGKHVNTFHYIMVSKSLTKKQAESLEKHKGVTVITKIKTKRYIEEYVKFNGYFLVLFEDCLISIFKDNYDNIIGNTIDCKSFNDIVFTKPVYAVYLTDNYDVYCSIKIKAINSPSDVICDCCTFNNKTQQIVANAKITILDVIRNGYGVGRMNPQQYCKDLFDEMMYSTLSEIYDGFNDYMSNYDLHWLKNNAKNVPVEIISTNGTSKEELESIKSLHVTVPKVDYWEDILNFKKRFPKKQKTIDYD